MKSKTSGEEDVGNRFIYFSSLDIANPRSWPCYKWLCLWLVARPCYARMEALRIRSQKVTLQPADQAYKMLRQEGIFALWKGMLTIYKQVPILSRTTLFDLTTRY
jgi:hypothetical protein